MPPDYETLLLQHYSDAEIGEIRVLMENWSAATYTSIAHSIVDHAERHGYQGDYLKYLRKAHNFNKRGAKKKLLSNGATRWNRDCEFLIERNGKIVSYGEN